LTNHKIIDKIVYMDGKLSVCTIFLFGGEAMAGKENLRPVSSKDEARERGRKGGLASGEARRKRKTLKEELLLMLSEGETQQSVTLALIEKAMSGDTKAFEVIRDTIGEKPVDKVQMKTDVNIADSAERLSNIFGQIKEEK
jgi:hypothetical protein